MFAYSKIVDISKMLFQSVYGVEKRKWGGIGCICIEAGELDATDLTPDSFPTILTPRKS